MSLALFITVRSSSESNVFSSFLIFLLFITYFVGFSQNIANNEK
jgi:hypothetical protein